MDDCIVATTGVFNRTSARRNSLYPQHKTWRALSLCWTIFRCIQYIYGVFCALNVVQIKLLLFWVSYLHVYFLPMVCDAVGYQYGHIQNVIGNLKNYGWYQDIFVAKNLVFFLKKYLWKGNRELVWRSPARTREGYFRIPQLLQTSWCDTTPLPQHQWQLSL